MKIVCKILGHSFKAEDEPLEVMHGVLDFRTFCKRCGKQGSTITLRMMQFSGDPTRDQAASDFVKRFYDNPVLVFRKK